MNQVASILNAEIALAGKTSQEARRTLKRAERYQQWLENLPDSYWEFNNLHTNEFYKNSIAVQISVHNATKDVDYNNIVYTLIAELCRQEGLSNNWEFPIVADATAAIISQMKRRGGGMSAWAHKQIVPKMARNIFKNFETLLVRF